MSFDTKSSVLVVFGEELPKKNLKWWRQFDRVIASKNLMKRIQSQGIFFIDIETLVCSGSVQQACELSNKLSRLILPDGSRLSKLITYQGYELWWIHYNDLMQKFCLPYTQCRRLLEYLKNFTTTYIYQTPCPGLFQYFLNVYNRRCVILDESPKFFPPFGILIQVLLSLPFLIWLKVTGPKLMVWTSDQFSPGKDCDFRMVHIYEELRKRKTRFVEFIRSQEKLTTVLKHALKRKRPVVYSGAIISLLYFFAKFFDGRKEKELMKLCVSKESSPENLFWILVATAYLRNFTGAIWSIKAMKFILQWIGVRAAIIIVGNSRTFHEILACKLSGIKTAGIQHGAAPQYYTVSEFMSGFDGELPISLDAYGLWSDWWKEYYISRGKAFKPEQLYVSGPMRPLEKEIAPAAAAVGREFKKAKFLSVLFISEQLAVPSEVMPYLSELLKDKDFSVCLKFRPYRDGFEEWLKENRPEILKKVKISRGDAHEAILQSDVVVGSHSTMVLEALLARKPFVFFRTGRWGDYFDLKSVRRSGFFAENPEKLLGRIRRSREIPKEVLIKLREKFFGNPYQNGSKWVVDQVIKFLKPIRAEKFKVLFIYPNTTMATLVPIHLSLLSAVLRENGFEAGLFDTTFYKTEEVSFEQKRVEFLQIKPFNFAEKGVQFQKTDIYEDLEKKIADFKPDLIAITIVEDTWELARALADRVKKFNIPVIAGGVFVTFSPEEVISHDAIDMICLGEGEGALLELCQKMSKGEDYSGVKNLWIKKEGKVLRNPLRPLIDINKLPYIDYDIFGKTRLYRPMFGKIQTMIHVEIDRGCPYTCTYCGAPRLRNLFQDAGCGTYYRRKNIDRLMAEMRHLVKKYHPDYINFNSETFLAKPIEELREFAGKYREIGIPFWCQTRPETITEEKVKILKEMGCDSLNFGIEHGNEEFRKKVLNRYSSNKQMIEGIKLVEKYKIPYTVNNIIGFPDETRELIFDTIELNRELNPRTINCCLFVPYKGTALRKYCLEKGYLEKNAEIHNMIDSVNLKMNSISYEELKGLRRTFPLYVGFPKSEWKKIKIAEKFNEKGNLMFTKLSKVYREKYF